MIKGNERTELLKKAVLTSVGATSNVERIKQAINEAFEDLSKVGQDLVTDLQESGKGKAGAMEAFLQKVQEEATRRSAQIGKQATTSTKHFAQELGLATRDDIKEILKRLDSVEEMLAGNCKHETHGSHKKES